MSAILTRRSRRCCRAEMWTEWIDDRQSQLAADAGAEPLSELVMLFERAIEDRLCTSL